MGNQKYSCNENYFAEKSLQACYWAGFIAADGWISEKKVTRKNKLGIKLSIKDENHLIQFKDDIQYSGVIYKDLFKAAFIAENTKITENKERVSLEITSQKICDDLENIFNVHPRKSLTHEPPVGLIKEQELAFIIGYLDGDGWIGIIKLKNKNLKYPLFKKPKI